MHSKRHFYLLYLFCILACCATLLANSFVLAQPPEVRARMMQAKMRAQQASQPQPNQKPNQKPDNKKDDKKDSAKKDEKKEDKKESGEVTRPDKPPKTPDPSEFEAKPDASGRVQFSFTGQPWPDVMQWLASISKLSLDWQKLPGGYLNLTTQRSYSLPEARNLINRHLQARGYAMLLSGEVLSVVKLDQVDPSLVPRISEEDLYDLQPYDIVKLTFELPEEMDPKKAVEDVKQALSKSAKVLPLATTKRLLVIDAVANLRMVSALLNEERLEAEGREIPRRFPLKYARAEKIINTLYVVMGLDPASQPSQMELQIQQQKMQLLMQMQQRGKDVARMLNKDGPKVYLAFNRHENSILANAPPEQMKIIARTIEMLDIPAPGSQAAIAGTEAGTQTSETYQLESIEPDSLINSLEEIGNLDPLTELRGDKKAKILFARASARDHKKIQGIIDKLDGSKYRVEVFWLRRHPADAVAGTIATLIAGKKEKKKENNRYSYFSWRYDDDDDEEEEVTELRVDADVENNRLIARGTEEQLAEVRELLVQIGELPGKQMGRKPVRVIDSIDRGSTLSVIEQLQKAWPAIGGGSELIIDNNYKPEPQTTAEEPAEDAKEDASEAVKEDRTANNSRDTNKSLWHNAAQCVTEYGSTAGIFRLIAAPADQASGQSTAEAQSLQAATVQATTGQKPPPVSITVTEDGRLVVSSDDPETLMKLEDLVATLAPSAPTFTEFEIEHVAAWYIFDKLELYFADALKGEEQGEILDWWGRVRNTGPKDATTKLSKRRPMQLIYNSVTNSIIASNASPRQLEEIGRLIEVWDKPPRKDSVENRRTGIVKIKYSRARTIEKALKEVYRDLLSGRDKEFDSEDDKGGSLSTEKLTQIEYSGGETGGKTQTTKAIRTRFGGTMSIGVDEIANMIVVSADAELYESVVDMIRTLDEEARPKTTVQVTRVNIPAERLGRALAETLGTAWAGGRPEKPDAPQQPNAEQQQPERDRGRRSRRRRDRD